MIESPTGILPYVSMAMSDVTRILGQIESGDPKAAEQLLPLVYEELRKLAADKMSEEQPGQTLQATALVHEAYLRLVNSDSVSRSTSTPVSPVRTNVDPVRTPTVGDPASRISCKASGRWSSIITIRPCATPRRSP